MFFKNLQTISISFCVECDQGTEMLQGQITRKKYMCINITKGSRVFIFLICMVCILLCLLYIILILIFFALNLFLTANLVNYSSERCFLLMIFLYIFHFFQLQLPKALFWNREDYSPQLKPCLISTLAEMCRRFLFSFFFLS